MNNGPERDLLPVSRVRASVVPMGPPEASNTGLQTFAVFVAAMYFGRDVLIPLATAILLTFALAPMVGWLVKRHMPRPVAVISVVISSFAAIFLLFLVVAFQLGSLAQNLPRYQNNIETKVASIKDARFGEDIISRISQMMERLSREPIRSDQPANTDGKAVEQIPRHHRFPSRSWNRHSIRCSW